MSQETQTQRWAGGPSRSAATAGLALGMLLACGAQDGPHATGPSDPAANESPPRAATAPASPPAESGRPSRVRITLGHGPCPAGEDCLVSIEARADGALEVDRTTLSDAHSQATLTDTERDALFAQLADPELQGLMRAQDPLCPAVHDVFERTVLEVEGQTLEQVTTHCQQTVLVRLRDALRRLALRHFGPFEPGFHSHSGWCVGVAEGMCPNEIGESP